MNRSELLKKIQKKKSNSRWKDRGHQTLSLILAAAGYLSWGLDKADGHGAEAEEETDHPSCTRHEYMIKEASDKGGRGRRKGRAEQPAGPFTSHLQTDQFTTFTSLQYETKPQT